MTKRNHNDMVLCKLIIRTLFQSNNSQVDVMVKANIMAGGVFFCLFVHIKSAAKITKDMQSCDCHSRVLRFCSGIICPASLRFLNSGSGVVECNPYQVNLNIENFKLPFE